MHDHRRQKERCRRRRGHSDSRRERGPTGRQFLTRRAASDGGVECRWDSGLFSTRDERAGCRIGRATNRPRTAKSRGGTSARDRRPACIAAGARTGAGGRRDPCSARHGAPGKELALARGVTYTFAVRTGIQHDFYFTTSPAGHGAGTVTDGVIGQFIYNGDAEFTPTPTTPPVVYYECRNHKYMGGKIHIANAGEKVVLGGASEPAEQATSAVTRNYTAEQVKQKLSFADMMTASSAAAKRVAASANAEAKQYAAEAKQQLASARTALGAGDNNGAMAAVDEALRLMNSATALVFV